MKKTTKKKIKILWCSQLPYFALSWWSTYLLSSGFFNFFFLFEKFVIAYLWTCYLHPVKMLNLCGFYLFLFGSYLTGTSAFCSFWEDDSSWSICWCQTNMEVILSVLQHSLYMVVKTFRFLWLSILYKAHWDITSLSPPPLLFMHQVYAAQLRWQHWNVWCIRCCCFRSNWCPYQWKFNNGNDLCSYK